MGAEKWLDIELWDAPRECFNVLRSRGYRIATTHVGMDAVFINPTSYWYSSMLPNICLEMFPPLLRPPPPPSKSLVSGSYYPVIMMYISGKYW